MKCRNKWLHFISGLLCCFVLQTANSLFEKISQQMTLYMKSKVIITLTKDMSILTQNKTVKHDILIDKFRQYGSFFRDFNQLSRSRLPGVKEMLTSYFILILYLYIFLIQ